MIVSRTLHVAASPQIAFEHFTDGIARWWPIEQFSYGGPRTSGIVLEAHSHGRFYERFSDGDELQLGHVITCDPPDRIVFTWQAPGWPAATEVEVRFTATADGTRIDVEHRAFERLGRAGSHIADGFSNGWPTVLAAFVADQPF